MPISHLGLNTEELQFRQANIKDIDNIEFLVNGAYRGESSKMGWTTEAELLGGQRTDKDSLKCLMVDPDSRIVIGEYQGKIVCCAHLKFEKISQSSYIGMIATEPKMQKLGLGKKIIEECELLAKNMNFGSLCMKVISLRQELIAFYQRRGYQPNGVKEKFPYGNPKFGLPKRDDLEFIVLEKKL